MTFKHLAFAGVLVCLPSAAFAQSADGFGHQYLREDINKNKKNISELKGNVNALTNADKVMQGDIAGNRSLINMQEGRIFDLEGQVIENTTQIEKNKQNTYANMNVLGAHDKRITYNRGLITTNQQDIDRVELVNKAQNERMDVLDEKHGKLGTEVGENGLQIDKNTQAISQNTAAIEKEQVLNKQQTEAIKREQQRNNAQDSRIDHNRNNIAENRADIDTNTTAIAENRADIDTNTNSLSDLQAWQTNINSAFESFADGALGAATQINKNTAAIAHNSGRIDNLEQDVEDLRGGVAMAVAIANAPIITNGENKFSLSGGLGYYEDAFALSAKGAFMPSNNVAITGSVATDFEGFTAGAGIGIGF